MATISQQTQYSYNGCLNRLKENGVDLSDPISTLQYLDDLEVSNGTKKNYLSAIIHTFKERGVVIPPPYAQKMATYFDEMNRIADSQTLTKNQKKNMMSWEDILAAQADYASQVRLDDFQDMRDFLILSLYTLNDPVRADYGDMKIYLFKEPKDVTGNYLVWGTKRRQFIFNDYKTSRSMGKIKIPVSLPLQKVLIQWFRFTHNMDWLLGEERSANWLTTKVRSIMKRLTGKEVGINILRHARITHLLGGQQSILSKNPVAKNMLHSRSTQEKYLILN